MSTDEEEIRQLVESWIQATREGDIDSVLSLMTDDAVFLASGQSPMGKEDFATMARAQSGSEAARIDGRSRIQEIKVLGDWAWMWTELTVTVMPSSAESIVRSGHTLSVLTREGGKWRLARDANMLSVVS
ncbi:hypothetical protein HCU01_13240 [Halomonas cupida]|uniref:DUF4440 domain-containing protein n=1 Tax=Halomonas cupida TaxID=44933 RepID=A0A1M7F3N1_9GAMM|nr:SgcJ/EcaC family oxidoreductase [Halomonas cupida]GEN23375.1 hypothetical protein HCU01_13240 [Halomonas cupida]SHL98289.1 conserved hypothetical protein [Halomonas cupida]